MLDYEFELTINAEESRASDTPGYIFCLLEMIQSIRFFDPVFQTFSHPVDRATAIRHRRDLTSESPRERIPGAVFRYSRPRRFILILSMIRF